MRNRLPIVLSAAALLVALLGSTPLGEAGVDAVRLALFAKNAGKVNGVRASRSPKPNRLVPLNANARLPLSVLPAPAGTSLRRPGPVSLAASRRTIARLALRPGKYAIFAKTWLRNESRAEAAAISCRLVAGRTYDETNIRLERSAEANARSLAIPLLLFAELERHGSATLRCADFDGRVHAFEIKVAAVRLARLTTRTQSR